MNVMSALVLAASVASAAAASNCSNPVFAKKAWGAPALELVAGKPQPHPTNPTYPCQAFAGGDSCCSNKTLESIQYFFKIGDELLNQTGMAIQNNDYPSQIASTISGQMNLLCSFVEELAFPSLKQDCEDAKSIVTKYSKELASAAQEVVETELTCAKGLSNYFKGALCFACEDEWEKFVIVDDEGDLVGFNVNHATCTSIVDECEPVNAAVIKVAQTAVDFAEALINELTSSLWPSMNLNLDDLINDLPDSCGGTMGNPGDCETFYCDSGVVSGISTPSQSNWGSNTAALSVAQRRALDAVMTASATVNTYTSAGYDAYSVGKADVPDQLTFPGWGIALIVVAVVLVVGAAVAGVVVVRRRRGVSRSVQYATTTAATTTAAPTEGAYGSFHE